MLCVLHGNYVGSGGWPTSALTPLALPPARAHGPTGPHCPAPDCLHRELQTLRSLRLGLLPVTANHTNHLGPVLLKSDILQIRIGARSTSEQFAGQDLVALSQNGTDPFGSPDFVPDYRYTVTAPLLYLPTNFMKSHDLRLLNVTLSASCLSKESSGLLSAVRSVGWDTVILNQIIEAVHDGGMLENRKTGEYWSWSKGLLYPKGGRGFLGVTNFPAPPSFLHSAHATGTSSPPPF